MDLERRQESTGVRYREVVARGGGSGGSGNLPLSAAAPCLAHGVTRYSDVSCGLESDVSEAGLGGGGGGVLGGGDPRVCRPFPGTGPRPRASRVAASCLGTGRAA